MDGKEAKTKVSDHSVVRLLYRISETPVKKRSDQAFATEMIATPKGRKALHDAANTALNQNTKEKPYYRGWQQGHAHDSQTTTETRSA